MDNNKKIMLVEDEHITALHIKKLLEEEGYEVSDIIDSGEEAIEILKSYNPDIILMDILLSGSIDGIDASKEIIKSYNVPIIYMTANADHATVERARSTNPYGYLNKPIDKRNLLTNVDSALNKYSVDKKIRECEKRFSTIFNSFNDAIITYDIDTGFIIDINNAMIEMFGYSQNEILNFDMNLISSGKDSYTSEEALKWVEKTTNEGPQVFEWQAKDKAGRLFWIEVSMTAANIENNERIIVVLRDIDERKKIYDELKMEKDLIETVIESVPGHFTITDDEDRLIRWGERGRQLTGYTKEEMAKMHSLDFIAESHQGKFKLAIEKLYKDGHNTEELNIRTKYGEIIPIYFSSKTIDYKGKKNHVSIGIDITELKKAQETINNLNKELLKLQEEKNRKLASDLHDSIIQTMTAAKINFQEFEENVKQNKGRYKLGIQFLDRAMDELREIYENLYPSILRDLGLEATIHWYIKKHLEANGIKTDLDSNIKTEITDEIKIHLYRIIQELFSNIVKHSGADMVKVSLSYSDENKFSLAVQDNGIGLNWKKTSDKGHGLANIQQRANYLGCTFNMKGIPGEETIIEITRDPQ